MLPEGDEGANGHRWRGYILLVVPIHTWLGSIVYQFANMVGFYWFVWYDLAPWSLAADMTHISCWRVATEPRDADWHSNLVVLTWHIPRPASATDDVRLCWRGKLYDAACIDWLTRSLLVLWCWRIGSNPPALMMSCIYIDVWVRFLLVVWLDWPCVPLLSRYFSHKRTSLQAGYTLIKIKTFSSAFGWHAGSMQASNWVFLF